MQMQSHSSQLKWVAGLPELKENLAFLKCITMFGLYISH